MASRDSNRIPAIQGVNSSNGSAVLPLYANPANNGLKVDDNTTGSDLGPTNDLRDQNFVPAFMAVSSVDGVTPVIVYVDSITNKLLITST